MKRCLVLLFTVALMAAAMASQAWTLWVKVNSPGPVALIGQDMTVPGDVMTVGGKFGVNLLNTNSGTNYPITGSNIKFGDMQVDPSFPGAATDNFLTPPPAGNYTAASLNIDYGIRDGANTYVHNLDILGHIEQYQATGVVYDPANNLYATNARWICDGIYDNTTSTLWNAIVPSAGSGFNSRMITFAPDVVNPDRIVNLWVDVAHQMPEPWDAAHGFSRVLDAYGTAVPEPGTLSLLLAGGVGGSIMLLGRRRKA